MTLHQAKGVLQQLKHGAKPSMAIGDGQGERYQAYKLMRQRGYDVNASKYGLVHLSNMAAKEGLL